MSKSKAKATASPAAKIDEDKNPQDKAVELVRQNDIEKLQVYLEENRAKKIINKLDTKTGKNVLIVASEEGRHDIIQMIIDNFKPNLNFKSKDGNTALIVASYAGEYESVEILVNAGANINTIGANGDTALHVACKRNWPGHSKIVSLLLSKDADNKIKNNFL